MKRSIPFLALALSAATLLTVTLVFGRDHEKTEKIVFTATAAPTATPTRVALEVLPWAMVKTSSNKGDCLDPKSPLKLKAGEDFIWKANDGAEFVFRLKETRNGEIVVFSFSDIHLSVGDVLHFVQQGHDRLLLRVEKVLRNDEVTLVPSCGSRLEKIIEERTNPRDLEQVPFLFPKKRGSL